MTRSPSEAGASSSAGLQGAGLLTSTLTCLPGLPGFQLPKHRACSGSGILGGQAVTLPATTAGPGREPRPLNPQYPTAVGGRTGSPLQSHKLLDFHPKANSGLCQPESAEEPPSTGLDHHDTDPTVPRPDLCTPRRGRPGLESLRKAHKAQRSGKGIWNDGKRGWAEGTAQAKRRARRPPTSDLRPPQPARGRQAPGSRLQAAGSVPAR